jgi:hypothetical protein
VDVARDCRGDLSGSCTRPDAAREQRRVGMPFLEVFDDGQGLRQDEIGILQGGL